MRKSKKKLFSSCILLYDILHSPIKRYFTTKKYYKIAKRTSVNNSKKLLVIGDPCTGNSNIFKIIQNIKPNCKHGDLTIDLYGCSKCERININDIDYFKKLKTNEYIVIESGTLSFCDNIKDIIKEIKRISGGNFYSAGSTHGLFWKKIGNKIYSKKYNSSINYIVDSFNFKKDKYFKVYNFKTKKKEKYLF